MPRSPILLSVRDLHVSVEGKEVVRGVSLDIFPGEVHVIMGPNGAGKSSLVQAIMGHPDFSVTRGSLTFRGKNFLILQPHERARGGLFLAFQHPRSIPGITLRSFLFASYNAQMSVRQKRQRLLSPVKFREMLSRKMGELHMDPILAERSLNLGFSGGEKKKAEVLQLSVCEPLLALLDETDAGLDIDALRVVAKGLKRLRKSQKFPPLSLLLVTHYARILRELTPDVIHIMVRGRIVESGGSALANRLEKEGYRRYLTKVRV